MKQTRKARRPKLLRLPSNHMLVVHQPGKRAFEFQVAKTTLTGNPLPTWVTPMGVQLEKST